MDWEMRVEMLGAGTMMAKTLIVRLDKKEQLIVLRSVLRSDRVKKKTISVLEFVKSPVSGR